eukprot:scaffold86_cov338-Pavlova_lutheri.AAC.93
MVLKEACYPSSLDREDLKSPPSDACTEDVSSRSKEAFGATVARAWKKAKVGRRCQPHGGHGAKMKCFPSLQ